MSPPRLYRLDAECPTCDHRPHLWIGEALYAAVQATPPRDVLLSVTCGRTGCATRFPVRAQAVHGAQVLRLAPAGGQVLTPAERAVSRAAEALSARQMEACALVVQGKSDVGIGAAMGLSAWTVRIHLGHAAARLRAIAPGLPSTAPRRTIQAYFAQQGAGLAARLA